MGDVLIIERRVRDSLGMTGDLVGALALGRTAAAPDTSKTIKDSRAVVHPVG
jgi:hypothetical protein